MSSKSSFPPGGAGGARRSVSLVPLLTLLLTTLGLACSGESPSEVIVSMPMVVAAGPTGQPDAHGRPFRLEMSQELTATVTGDPDGAGEALITLNPGQRTICWELSARNIALPATASHIHTAPVGLSGPIVLGLTPPGADGTSSGCAHDVDGALMADILRDPGAYYVNVHTTEHPPGAIRSQLDE